MADPGEEVEIVVVFQERMELGANKGGGALKGGGVGWGGG